MGDHRPPRPRRRWPSPRPQATAASTASAGSAIYRALLPHAHRLLVTEVDLTIPDADAFFPDFDEGEWRKIWQHPLRADGPGCVLTEWVR